MDTEALEMSVSVFIFFAIFYIQYNKSYIEYKLIVVFVYTFVYYCKHVIYVGV